MKIKNSSQVLGHHLIHNHRGLLEGMRRLSEDLSRLRYEGKPSFGRNLKKVRASLKAFLKDFREDTGLEEGVVFPFLKKHVPKLSFMLQILEEEHGDLQRNVAILESFVTKIGQKKAVQDTSLIDRLIQKGNYVQYFLRNHSSAENECVCRVMEAELNVHERKELRERFRIYQLKQRKEV